MTSKACEAFNLVPGTLVIDGNIPNEPRDVATAPDTRLPPTDVEGTAKTSELETSQFLNEPEVAVEEGRRGGKCPCVQEPEGRDAWIVATVCSFITFGLSTEYGCFGMYYPEYTKMFNTSKASVGWIKGIQGAAGGLFGLVTSSLVKVYGAKLMCCVAGMCLTVGYLGASLSPNIYVSYLTHGVIAGIGVNIATTSVLVIIQQHFTRNGVLGSGISFFGFAIGHFSTGIITSDLISAYGPRGALLMHSAIFAHIIPLGLMLRRPPKSNKTNPTQKTKQEESICHRVTHELCDFTLFGDSLFVLVVIAAFLTWYTTAAFTSHLPSRAMYHGVSMREAAYLQTAMGAAAFVGRVTSTFLANIPRVDVVIFYALTLASVAAGPLSYAFLTSYDSMFLSPILFGFGMGSSTTVYVVVLVRMFKVERLPRALGLYQIVSHTGMSLGPPLSGLIFDKTSNYDIPFILSGALGMLASLLIFVTAILNNRRQHQMAKA